MEIKHQILNKYFGYQHFKPNQEAIINCALKGDDLLAVLATGGGKSLCYQIPALAKPGVCLVISPLIALMDDQSKGLINKGIDACSLGGITSQKDLERISNNWLQKAPKFIFTSPERLNNFWILERLKQLDINYIVFDEAHCISHWGHQFRPQYRKVGAIKKFWPNTPIIALTATATDVVKKDIIETLALKNPQQFQGNFIRSNLRFMLLESPEKSNDVLLWCKTVVGSKIVYLNRRNYCEQYAEYLNRYNVSALPFHAALNSKTKTENTKAWMHNKAYTICATSAFGMGIDKADVQLVINPFLSQSPEDLYQEAGRAGRNGDPALALALYNQTDLKTLKDQLQNNFPTNAELLRHYTIVYNYFRVATHDNKIDEDEIDLELLSKKYNTSVFKAYQCLKLLEKEGILILNENGRPFSQAQLILQGESLHRFIVENKGHQKLLECLVRAYPGISGNKKTIDTYKISKALSVKETDVEQQLEKLHKRNIIIYKAKSTRIQISLLENRYHRTENSFKLSKQLRSIAANQYLFFEKYISDKSTCRQQMFAEYFNSQASRCSICDNCLRASKQHYASEKDILQFCKTARTLNDFKTKHIAYILYPEHCQKIISELLDKKHLILKDGAYFCPTK